MFFPLFTRPKIIASHTATLLLEIFINNLKNFCNSGVLFSDVSDHLLIPHMENDPGADPGVVRLNSLDHPDERWELCFQRPYFQSLTGASMPQDLP